MKVLTVVGARPQFIKMALVSKAMRAAGIEEVVVHTGQHYDADMSDVFFTELGIAAPRYNLGVGSMPRVRQIGAMARRIGPILRSEGPDAVLVYGDTNSTAAGAMAASKIGIPLAHVEAGLRSYDDRMPEERNRILADRLSQLLLCPTREAVSNLKREGIRKGVHLTGDVMYDSIKNFRPAPRHRRKGGYILCTIHRQENTDSSSRLKRIFGSLALLDTAVVLPLHPRTAKCMAKYGIKPPANVKLLSPLPYGRMLDLEGNSDLIITDSGGVQKEAFIFKVPCVTIRDTTEWTETVRAGMNVVAGTDPEKIVRAVRDSLGKKTRISAAQLYGDGRAHVRIARMIKREFGG